MRFFAVLAITAAVSLTKGDKQQVSTDKADAPTTDDDTKPQKGGKGPQDDDADSDDKKKGGDM